MIKTIARNILVLLVLDLIALPIGVALYLTHGFHIAHIVLGIGYIYGLVLVYDTAAILTKCVLVTNAIENQEVIEEAEGYEVDDDSSCQDSCEGCECDSEPLKPEMEQAMNEAFNIRK